MAQPQTGCDCPPGEPMASRTRMAERHWTNRLAKQITLSLSLACNNIFILFLEKDKNTFKFQIAGPSRSFIVVTKTMEDKMNWWNCFKEAIETNVNTAQHPINKSVGPRRVGTYQFKNRTQYTGEWVNGNVPLSPLPPLSFNFSEIHFSSLWYLARRPGFPDDLRVRLWRKLFEEHS